MFSSSSVSVMCSRLLSSQLNDSAYLADSWESMVASVTMHMTGSLVKLNPGVTR